MLYQLSYSRMAQKLARRPAQSKGKSLVVVNRPLESPSPSGGSDPQADPQRKGPSLSCCLPAALAFPGEVYHVGSSNNARHRTSIGSEVKQNAPDAEYSVNL